MEVMDCRPNFRTRSHLSPESYARAFAPLVLVSLLVADTWAQETRDAPGRPIANYQQILARLEASAAATRAARVENEFPNIMLTGYWPPTNEMIRQFSDDPVQNPQGWAGGNWEGHGYDIFAFFPEFPNGPGPNCCCWGQGVGDFEVDYQDTTADWLPTVNAIDPIAIITFSRGGFGHEWELEFVQRNLFQWSDDFSQPLQPTPQPPDGTETAGYTRCSTLPMVDIVNAVAGANLGLTPFIDYTNFGGGFVSEYVAYHGVWTRDMHAFASDANPILAAGHIHVGFTTNDPCDKQVPNLILATEVTLRTLIDHLDNFDPQIVGDRCPDCCLHSSTGANYNSVRSNLNVNCWIFSFTCKLGENKIYKVFCKNEETSDVTIEWNLCNDNDNCSFDDRTDVSFPTLDTQNCEDFNDCGTGAVPGTNCGCTRSGTFTVPPTAGMNFSIQTEVQCPSWTSIPYTCPVDTCCDCMQGFEDDCATNSANYANAGDRACVRLDWFATTNQVNPKVGRRHVKMACITLTDDGEDAVLPGVPAYPEVSIDPPFAEIPVEESITLLIDITNPAEDERQFNYTLRAESLNMTGLLLNLSAVSGVASSEGNGTPMVTGQTELIDPGQTLQIVAQVFDIPSFQTVENEIFVTVTDPLATEGVPVSAIVLGPLGLDIPAVSGWRIALSALLVASVGMLIFSRRGAVFTTTGK